MIIIILFLRRNALGDFDLDFKQEVRKLYVLIVIIMPRGRRGIFRVGRKQDGGYT